jgi:hypothetical protein
MTNSYISLYIHIVFNRPDGTFVLSYLHPAMNRRAIVTDALPAPRLSACAKALADRRQAGLSWGIKIGLS